MPDRLPDAVVESRLREYFEVELGRAEADFLSFDAVRRPAARARRASGFALASLATISFVGVLVVGRLLAPVDGGPPATHAAIGSPPPSSPTPSTTARPSDKAPVTECGSINAEACATAIALARAADTGELLGTTRIVVADVCPPQVSCDRKYPFDSLVVFVTAGGDTTGWISFEVTGLEPDKPTEARRYQGDLPRHVIDLLTEIPTPTRSVPPTMPPAGVALPYPEGCATYGMSTRRCDYVVAWAKREAGYSATDPVTVQLLGDPACPDGSTTCVVSRSTAFVVRVRVTGSDGATNDESVFCGLGGEHSFLCSESPVIQRRSPMGDYTDVPCARPAPDDPCATPVPTPDPSATKAARPLVVPRTDIPIDHVGTYTVQLGEATLANGILREAGFDLADDAPTDMLVSPYGVSLEIKSLDGGRPFENIYAHGWHPGTERVAVTLTFEVESFGPGAVLEVTNLVVR